MTKIEAQVPDYLARQAREAAEREQVSKRANLADFDRIMAMAPDAPPMPSNELPPGYNETHK